MQNAITYFSGQAAFVNSGQVVTRFVCCNLILFIDQI